MLLRFALASACLLALACGARSTLEPPPDAGPPPDLGPLPDLGLDLGVDGGVDSGPDFGMACVPVDDGCLAEELCGNGTNDDCDDAVDEGCGCVEGTVQPCFLGPPGRRDVGACQDGSQVCLSGGTWGACEGGVLPDPVACTGRDDLCNGCSTASDCEIDCPSPGDPRITRAVPFEEYDLIGTDFYRGEAARWQWAVEGGNCDALAPNLESFTLARPRPSTAILTPRLSGDYRVTLAVTQPDGDRLSCSWVVNATGPGLRVEMCYPESETVDLDLYMHRSGTETDWYQFPGTNPFLPSADSCGWHNCQAFSRAPSVGSVDWGYPNTALSNCEEGPEGNDWRAVGFCRNPRLDIDNNLSGDAIGVPENINLDVPRDGDNFRIMVQNFTGSSARPLINVYCDGRRVSTLGQAPDTLVGFAGRSGSLRNGVGAMWRAADVAVSVDDDGAVTCEVEPLHPPGRDTGFWITQDNAQF